MVIVIIDSGLADRNGRDKDFECNCQYAEIRLFSRKNSPHQFQHKPNLSKSHQTSAQSAAEVFLPLLLFRFGV